MYVEGGVRGGCDRTDFDGLCTCDVRVSAYAGQLFPKSIFKVIQCENLHNDTWSMCEIWNDMYWK